MAVDHPGRAPFFVPDSASVDHAILSFAGEGIPLPLGFIADANRINMAVIQQFLRPAADSSENITHLVEANFVITQPVHFGGAAFSHRPDLAVITWNGTQIAQELHNRFTLLGYAGLDCTDKCLRVCFWHCGDFHSWLDS